MGKKLYVGNLPYTTTDENLTSTFGAFGTVDSVKIITDRESGRSKGFGFVEMQNDDEAEKAISSLNGSDFGGRKIVVSEARAREEGGGGRGGRGGGGGGGFRGGRGGGGGGGFRGGRGGGGGGYRDE